MRTTKEINEMGAELGANFGKIFKVRFKKVNGEERSMTARQGIRGGISPLKPNGRWANGNADPTDHLLVLCTDMEKEKRKEFSRRSFKLDQVLELNIGGKQFKFD